MKITPEISVIMAVYNGEKYLEEAVDSILNQSYFNFELIIIDDASIDATQEILFYLSKKDGRISILRNKRNLGAAKARNKGLHLARGSFIAIMDADDYAFPNRLQKQIEYMTTHHEIAVCGGYMEIYEKNGSIIKTLEENEEIRARLLFENCIWHPTVMFRKEIVLKTGCRYRTQSAEDYDFFIRLSRCHEIIFRNIPEVLTKYRIHPNNDRTEYAATQRALSRKIRKNQLAFLGLSPNEKEFICHENLSCLEAFHTKEFTPVEQYADWLRQLESANNKTQLYLSHIFRKELELRWIEVCLKTSFEDPRVAISFLKTGSTHLSLQKLYMAARMFWRYFKNNTKKNIIKNRQYKT
ncbi:MULTISPECIES: glycosyltransferase family 2 protein [Methylomonas]|nr:glycosyltransferase [Methylomonas koyamae]